MSVKEELAVLAAELRARTELFEECEFSSGENGNARDRGARCSPIPSAPGENRNARDRGARCSPIPSALAPEDRWSQLGKEVDACRACPLGSQRLRAVFGVGNRSAKVLFVGEGPGFQEDRQGEPFVGKAGQLLDKILESIGLSRKTVYIANVVKCHPMINPADPDARGNDRPPTPEEMDACRHFLEEQIRMIAPKVIVTLGAVAAKALIGPDVSISRIRGQWKNFSLPEAQGYLPLTTKLLPTYHPAALLRNPDLKKDVWTDMKNLREELKSDEG